MSFKDLPKEWRKKNHFIENPCSIIANNTLILYLVYPRFAFKRDGGVNYEI